MLAILAVLGCEDFNPAPPLAATPVLVIQGPTEIGIGQRVSLLALLNGVSVSAQWGSNNPGVAIVSSTGVAEGIAVGVANIAATFQGVTATHRLQVR